MLQDNSRNNNGFVNIVKIKRNLRRIVVTIIITIMMKMMNMDGCFARNSGFNMGGNNNGYNNTSASSSLPRVKIKINQII